MMLNQIVHMEDNIKVLGKNDFRFIAHKMELERIKYIISSYLRCRLKKIEKFGSEIIQQEEGRTEKRLSHEEHEFAVAYITNMRNHFHHIALKHMPLNLQETTAREVVRPNIAEHVFLKANVSGSLLKRFFEGFKTSKFSFLCYLQFHVLLLVKTTRK